MQNIVYILFVVNCLIHAVPANAQFDGGSGTLEDPYRIVNLEQLQSIAQADHLDKHFILVDNINASETSDWHNGDGFVPIGWWDSFSENAAFSGSFDGDNFVISNLTIHRVDEDNIGLFGYADGATIKNVVLQNINISGGNTITGSLVAYGRNNVQIQASHVQGEISGNNIVGGLIGASIDPGASIDSSSFTGVIMSNNTAGGLVGRAFYIHIQNSYTDIEITGGEQSVIGGLVGEKWLGTLDRSYSTGKISGKDMIGGLIGQNYGGDVHDSYASVDVTGESHIGGLVGKNHGPPIPLIPTKVLRIDEQYTQYNDNEGAIWTSYAVGKVSGVEKVGGLVGENVVPLQSSYWDTVTTTHSKGVGLGNSDHIRGLNTEKMTGENAWIYMHELDFEETWQLTEGYPMLRWQKPENVVDPPEASILTIDPREEECDFGAVESDSSKSREFMLTNTGNIQMNVEISLSGADAHMFEISNGEGSWSLDPGSIRVVEVVFSPESVDTFQAVLEISHDAPNEESPLEVTLLGSGKSINASNPDEKLPERLELHQNYPNPFNPGTVIRYELPRASEVHLEVFDLLGRRVATLVNEWMQAGRHEIPFDASRLASGIYVYRIQAGNFIQTRRMTFIK